MDRFAVGVNNLNVKYNWEKSDLVFSEIYLITFKIL